LGRSMALMVDMAETEFCAVIHGDDICLPRRLESQVEFLWSNPKVGIVGSQIEILDENGDSRSSREWQYPLEDAEIRWISRWLVRVCHPATMFRRSVILNAGNYRDCAPIEDADLWIRAANRCEVRNLPDVLLHYRRTQTSQTGTVTDWIPHNRRAAQMNAAILFPNIADPDIAMELWEVTHPVLSEFPIPVKAAHIIRLERAATLLARKVGKPDHYFKNTSAYRGQQYHLRRRLVENLGLGPLLRIKQAVQGRTVKR
jgi:Glycosyl transferase family 2